MAKYSDGMIAVMVTFLICNGLAVGARVYSRVRITRSFGADDAMLCLTYVGWLILCGLGFTAIYYGYGAEDHKAYSTLLPRYDPDKAEMFYYANQLTVYIDSGLVKLAVALVLLRLAATRPMRWLLIGSMVVVVVWTIVMTIYASYLCAGAGTSNYAGSETCNFVGYFRTTTNIVIDYFYALLPVYMLWNVKLRLTLKLSAMALLGLGVLASASTIVKLVIVIRLNHAKGDQIQPMHYQLLLWADSELGLAIFAASLAAIRPLLAKFNVPNVTKWSTTRSTNVGPATSGIDATGPYKEIRPTDISINSVANEPGAYVKRHVTVDIESYEMRQVDSHKRQLHETRTAIWTDDRSEKSIWSDLDQSGRKPAPIPDSYGKRNI